MGPSSKARLTIKVPPGKAKQFEAALALLEAQYIALGQAWPQLTKAQRAAVMEHSSLLVRIVAMARPMVEAERG